MTETPTGKPSAPFTPPNAQIQAWAIDVHTGEVDFAA